LSIQLKNKRDEKLSGPAVRENLELIYEEEREEVGTDFVYGCIRKGRVEQRSTNPQWDSAHPDAFGSQTISPIILTITRLTALRPCFATGLPLSLQSF
jgi:hypothetical protein